MLRYLLAPARIRCVHAIVPASRRYISSTETLGSRPRPLVWIDVETTGLDPKKAKILEIAVLITDGNLELLDSGIEYVVKHDKQTLDTMDEWCIKQHGQSGLTEMCLNSPHTTDSVSQAVLEYMKKWIPKKRVGMLAGSSVHFDRSFLIQEMPEVVDWLHYRIVDTSSVMELCKRWNPALVRKLGESSHRALGDIHGSLRELQWYQKHFFVTDQKDSSIS